MSAFTSTSAASTRHAANRATGSLYALASPAAPPSQVKQIASSALNPAGAKRARKRSQTAPIAENVSVPLSALLANTAAWSAR